MVSDENEILGEPCCSLKGALALGFAPCFGTALWNGVYFSAKLKLAPQTGRKALLLLTDGWDTGSDYRLQEATKACQGADTVVFSIRHVDPTELLPDPGHPVDPSIARGIRKNMEGIFARARRDLQRISRETGGEVFEGNPANLAATLKKVDTALRTQYVLGYEQPAVEPGYHKIEVKVRHRGMKVRARTGYYA
jgi:VWFA-related protein